MPTASLRSRCVATLILSLGLAVASTAQAQPDYPSDTVAELLNPPKPSPR